MLFDCIQSLIKKRGISNKVLRCATCIARVVDMAGSLYEWLFMDSLYEYGGCPYCSAEKLAMLKIAGLQNDRKRHMWLVKGLRHEKGPLVQQPLALDYFFGLRVD